MRCNLSFLLTLATVVSLIGSSTVHATVTVTTTTNVAPILDPHPVHQIYDPVVDTPGSGPQLSASSTDLAQGLTVAGGGVWTTGNDQEAFAGGLDRTTDGSLATVYNQGGPAGDDIDHAGYASVFSGDLVTYNLGGLFNLTQVDVYAGWPDHGRDDFSFDLLVSADGSDFTQIATALKGPNVGGPVPITNRYRIEDDGGAFIATGVQYVQLSIFDADNGWAGLAEVDIFGAPVPEPTTIVMLGLASFAMAIRRQR